MCTLAIYRGVSDVYPLVIAANRDELFSRPATAPCRWDEYPGLIAGRDIKAGGTWLGCRTGPGVVVAGMLNRRSFGVEAPSAPGSLSRGLLCLDVLEHTRADAALERLTDESVAEYGPFNLLIADRERAVVIDNACGSRITELDAGLSVLTNLDVNDPRCPRLANAVPRFEAVCASLEKERPVTDIVAELRDVLGDHDNRIDPGDDSPLSRLCVHTEQYGTRSSSIIMVGQDGAVRYFHADGPPCTNDFRSVAVGG